MSTPDLSTPRRVHIIGIGGAGMGAIAEVLHAMGHEVAGSDLSDYGEAQLLTDRQADTPGGAW